MNGDPAPQGQDASPQLARRIGLPLLILYGMGVTIGAGIYVLIGETTARAGTYGPTSFLVAAVIMAFSAASFAELCGRVPRAAGEALYVASAFHRPWLTLATGGLVLLAAIVAAATISLGSAGYMSELIPLPRSVLTVGVVGFTAALAAWGIRESVIFAAVLTLVEITGLLAIIGLGFWTQPDIMSHIPQVVPPLSSGSGWSAVLAASLLAFFAFIGFDDTVNLAEESPNPERLIPWAIAITLVIVTALYFLVSLVAVTTLSAQELQSSNAPVALLYEKLTGASPVAITLIGVFATLNGVVIQIIMASRVLYGLASSGHLPKGLGRINSATQTPVFATTLVAAVIVVLVLLFPLEGLAEMTSTVILVVFMLVNLALVRIKLTGVRPPANAVEVPLIAPVLGAITCIFLMIGPRLL